MAKIKAKLKIVEFQLGEADQGVFTLLKELQAAYQQVVEAKRRAACIMECDFSSGLEREVVESLEVQLRSPP